MDKLRDYLNLESIDELHMFIRSTKKTTSKMKYDRMMKAAFEKLQPLMRAYLTEQDQLCKDCMTLETLEELRIAPITDEMRDLILTIVDTPKDLTIVEKTYMALDLFRSVTGTLGGSIAKMVLHYGNALRMAPKIIQQNGKSY